MVTFDATSREACIVQRTRTNTPLQALALMNDVTFVEAARVGAAIDDRCRWLDRRSTCPRLPHRHGENTSSRRIGCSRAAFSCRSLEIFRNDPSAAHDLVHVGEFVVNEKLDVCELAAGTTVTSLILNLDEVVNKK